MSTDDTAERLILWSDDDWYKGLGRTVGVILENWHLARIVPATTEEETLRLARRLRPDLVVTDQHKGTEYTDYNWRSGERLARALRDDRDLADIPILLCTAYPIALDGEYAQLFDACLPKPFRADELIETLGSMLAKRP